MVKSLNVLKCLEVSKDSFDVKSDGQFSEVNYD